MKVSKKRFSVNKSFVNGQILARGLKNGAPSFQTATYRKTEVIQRYFRIWGTYDPIESGPSDPKKWGLYMRSVKKCRFLGQNRAPATAPRPAVQRNQHKNVVFLLSGHDGNKKIGRFWQKNWFCAKNCIFGPKFCIFLRYTYETPIFWLRRNWLNGIISPPYPELTLDNFGFPVGGRLATRRTVLWPKLPKVALLGSKNAVFWPETIFLWSASK